MESCQKNSEKWVKIPDSDIYFISNYGRVKKVLNNNVTYKKVYSNKKRRGYCYISIRINGVRKNLQVHRIVAKMFIENKDNKPCVNHKDFNTKNNSVDNLEWVTHKENTGHSKANMVLKFGQDSPSSILKENDVISIFKERKLTGTKYLDLAKKYNTNYSNVAHIMRGSRWGKITEKIKL